MDTLAEARDSDQSAFGTAPRVDHVLATVLQRKLKSIVRRMGFTLLRTTRSPVLFDAKDFGTGLYDAEGGILEQQQYMPIHSFSLPPGLKGVIRYFGDDIHPGDVILHNDTFTGGNQYADLAVYKPIFFRNTLVGWSGAKGHMLDIGGAVPGAMNTWATEVWQEALRITPVKVYNAGRFRRDVWDMIFANVRVSPIVQADVRAEIGCCNIGERGVLELVSRFGYETFLAHTCYLADEVERLVRQEIAAMPNGRFSGESYVYNAAGEGTRSRVCVTVEIRGDEISFDFAGTDPQVRGFVNAPLAASLACVYIAFLMLIDPNIPFNEGMLRPVHVNIPEGMLLNARFPAATGYGNHLGDQIHEAITRALAEPLRERVTAGWTGLMTLLSGYTRPDRNRFISSLFFASKGGSGGTYGADGYDHIGSVRLAGALEAEDPELYEVQYPAYHIRKYEYAPDSGGPGRWRGGLGVDVDILLDGEDMTMTNFGIGVEEPAFGLFGGEPGSYARAELVEPDGSVRVSGSKEIIDSIGPGVLFRKRAPGGGGFGDPYLRPAEVVAREVRNGLVSMQQARERYGVAVDPRTSELDWAQTSRLRSSRPIRDDSRWLLGEAEGR